MADELRFVDLGFQGNPMTSLPTEVWEMRSLTTLNIAHTGIREIPPEAARIVTSSWYLRRRQHALAD